MVDAALELRVLFVCTANVCRSPMAAGIMRSLAPDRVRVASAGFLPPGAPIDPNTQRVLDRIDVSMQGRSSRQLDRSLVLGADLVLTMTAAHSVQIISAYPTAQSSLYSLRHFARAATARYDHESVEAWLRRLDRATPRNYAAGLRDLDIDDPIGKPQSVFDEVADVITPSLSWLVRSARLDGA